MHHFTHYKFFSARLFFILCIILIFFCLFARVDALLKDIPLTIHTKEPPQNLSFKVEVCETPDEKEYGLMFRKNLPEHTGMFFLYNTSTPVKIWMKNTYIPLDILFFDERGVIHFIVENAVPFDLTPRGPTEKSKAFLELPEGTVKKYQIKLGDFIESPAFPATFKIY